MALLIDLKSGEKVIVGQAVICNDGPRTRLRIDGEAAILREKDILKPDDSNTACKQLYLLLQLMYLDRQPERLHAEYFELVRQIREAAPSTLPMLLTINQKIIEGSYYKALKEAKKLIVYEGKLLANV